MLSRRLQLISLVMLAIAVAGCGAPRPVKYYVIDPNFAPATTPASSGQFPVALLVGRFASSTLYRDDRLVYGSGPVELGTYEFDRWAEPPVDMVQNLLIADLRNSGQFRSVSRVSTNVRGDYVVRGHLIAMYGVDKPDLVARFTSSSSFSTLPPAPSFGRKPILMTSRCKPRRWRASSRPWTATSGPVSSNFHPEFRSIFKAIRPRQLKPATRRCNG